MTIACPGVCRMDGCGQPVLNVKRQLCQRHYRRYLQHGDPDITHRPDLGKTLTSRFWEKVNKDAPIPAARRDLGRCWMWTAGLSKGYGQFIVMAGHRGRPILAHRMAWELLRGSVPDGLELDHLCRVRACVNPDHLEPVTSEENIRRGMWGPVANARKTHCAHGHEFTPENTYRPPRRPHVRQCRECMRLRGLKRRKAATS